MTAWTAHGPLPARQATAAQQAAMDMQRASIRRDLESGWLDQLHATTVQIHVLLVDLDRTAPEVTAVVDGPGCHPEADCWAAHAPGPQARRYAADVAVGRGQELAYVSAHPADATLWLAYLRTGDDHEGR